MDQRVVLHGVTWPQYEAILAIRGEGAGVRLTYLRGELELMSPSKDHELIKKTLARLVEAYTEERGIELTGYGSWTIKSAEEERGAEADECYVLGNERPERPDLAIEVVWTSGGIDKLEVYRGLGVKEVWFWKEDRITVWELTDERYAERDRSRLLPDLDFVRLAGFLDLPSQTQAVIALRAWVRGGGAPDSRLLTQLLLS
jgi:Uma2 family endonuclease